MREFGHSLGSRSRGQKIGAGFDTLSSVEMSEDLLERLDMTLRKEDLRPLLPDSHVSDREADGDGGGALDEPMQAHVLNGWPCSPWTITMLCSPSAASIHLRTVKHSLNNRSTCLWLMDDRDSGIVDWALRHSSQCDYGS